MKYLLFGYHDNRPMNKYIYLIFAHFGLKTTSFLNTHKTYRCKVSTLKVGDSPIHTQFEQLILIEVREPNLFGRTGGKIGLKWKMLQIPGYLGTIFPVPPRISEPV